MIDAAERPTDIALSAIVGAAGCYRFARNAGWSHWRLRIRKVWLPPAL